MKIRSILLTVVLGLINGSVIAAEETHFTTNDGIEVYGDLYRSEAGTNGPLILLFHQAGGDARGEYGPLVSRLVEAGFNALAIDQRVGGDRFGGVNRTLEGLDGQEYEYCDVYPDLEGALKHARSLGFNDKVAIWGSSYSAALVFQLASRHPAEIDAVLAFSPASGGPLADCAPKLYSAALEMPVLALRPVGEMEIQSAATQLERFRSEGHATFVADPGVHGSSMLNPERVGASTDEAWAVVLEFLGNSFGGQPDTAQSSSQDAFFQQIANICGARFTGQASFPDDPGDAWRDQDIVAYVETCKEDEIRIPLSVGEDHSRTWVLRRTEGGLELKHDHRHKDGTPDEVTLYGGTALSAGSHLAQSFPADAYTAELIPDAATNEWFLSFSEDGTELTYYLERHSEPRFRAILKKNLIEDPE